MKIIIIVAVSENNVIGKEGKIPWHSGAELKHFKETTMGNPIIMGRKTFESIGKVLPGRLNIVLTGKAEEFKNFEDLIIASSLDEALNICREQNQEKVFIIGGASVYEEALNFADEIILTRMKLKVDGDTYFPHINFEEWSLKKKEEREEFNIEVYERRKQ